MKLYLDDLRCPPFGWDLVRTADECIAVLESGKVEELSLDHDLADEHYASGEPLDGYREKTGMSVVDWMVETGTWPTVVYIHTLNPVGRGRMLAAVQRHAPEHVRCIVRPAFV
jgi:hypothetical protein